MLRFAWLALVAGIVLPVAARAQAAPTTGQGFGFCTVTDTSSAQATIWASPVFPLEYPGSDPGGFQRGLAVAGEFLAHVRTLGASGGDKNCIVVATQGEAARFREEQRAIWDKRVYFIKIGDWREVAWTPAPWKPAQAVAGAAPVTRYFLCQATQTDIPDRSDRIRSVASGVFAMPVPADDALGAGFAQAKAYAAEFQSVVQAHGLPVQGDCMVYDTRDEAQYAYQQMLRLLKGFNQKFTEVAWTPTGRTPAAAPPSAAPVPQQAVEAATTVDATPQPSIPATPATSPDEQALYCTGFVTRAKPAMMVRAPVRKEASPSYSETTAKATLSALLTAVKQAYPGNWHDLSQIGCGDNNGVIAGEKVCVVAAFKRFGGGIQTAGVFCNASRAMIDQRWAGMVEADGGHAQIFPWPESP